jgi:hypothetical protein
MSETTHTTLTPIEEAFYLGASWMANEGPTDVPADEFIRLAQAEARRRYASPDTDTREEER